MLRKATIKVIEACVVRGAKKATAVLSPGLTVVAAMRHKPSKKSRSYEVVLTIGKPNFANKKFIEANKKAGEPFPIKKIQLKWWKK